MMIRTSLTKPAMDKRWFGWKVGPKGSGKSEDVHRDSKAQGGRGSYF